eukprot:GHUV01011706.1.p1 GENE.GHUV01011706.1~~GHUV01011706.1.p1  ORF type:complete len:352 (+),score=99.59 GHUV01011706.1:95-1150(+)
MSLLKGTAATQLGFNRHGSQHPYFAGGRSTPLGRLNAVTRHTCTRVVNSYTNTRLPGPRVQRSQRAPRPQHLGSAVPWSPLRPGTRPAGPHISASVHVQGRRIVICAALAGVADATDTSVLLKQPVKGNDQLVTGQLANGLRYVLLPNPTPPERFEAHLEVHVGSVDERADEQVGALGEKQQQQQLQLAQLCSSSSCSGQQCAVAAAAAAATAAVMLAVSGVWCLLLMRGQTIVGCWGIVVVRRETHVGQERHTQHVALPMVSLLATEAPSWVFRRQTGCTMCTADVITDTEFKLPAVLSSVALLEIPSTLCLRCWLYSKPNRSSSSNSSIRATCAVTVTAAVGAASTAVI